MQTSEPQTLGRTRPSGPPAPTAPSLGHRPGLDGLRGLAVLAVLAYHTGLLRSGWIGVDVFFALSGYLITGLLVTELDATGTVSLRRFWARRFRRLVPGVVLLLGLVAVLGALGLPGWRAPKLTDLVGTMTYSANWLRIAAQHSYWDLFRTPGPLEHVWSLAIEEQFYVVWPIVVLVVGRRWRDWLGPVTAFGLVLTAGVQVWLGYTGASVERLYVGTDTRAPAFLLGALMVLQFDRRGRPAAWAAYTVPVGLAWLLATCVILDGESIWTYRGVLLAVSTLGAFTVLGAARLPAGSPIHRLLVAFPLQRLGRWSYGVYLFHWPVAVALRGQEMLAVQRFVLVAVISIALAAASYELLEHPIRQWGVPWRWRLPAVACSGVILLASCGNVAPDDGRSLDAATRAQLLAPLPAAFEPPPTTTTSPAATVNDAPVASDASDAPDGAGSSATPAPVTTTVPATTVTQPPTPDSVAATPETAIPVASGSGRVLVLGDSVPFQLEARLTEVAAGRGVTVAVRAAPGCTPSEDPLDYYRNDSRDICANAQAVLADDLATFAPQALVLFYGLAGPSVYSHGAPLMACSDEGSAALAGQLERIVGLARAAGTTVFLVPPANPPELPWLDAESQAVGADCYRSVYLDVALRSDGAARLLRLDQLVCPDPRDCPGTVDGVELRYDGIHYSDAGASYISPWLLDRLLRPAL